MLAVWVFTLASTFADPVIDGRLGPSDDYSHGFAVTASVEKGPTITDAELFLHKGASGDMSVLLRFPRTLNDNTYGDNAIGWGKDPVNPAPSGKNHNFKDLEGSDTAEFFVTLAGRGGDDDDDDDDGGSVLGFEVDFIDGNGPFVHGLEGEGGMLSGSASDILATATSMSYNASLYFNSHPELFVNENPSPAASSSYVVIDPTFSDWEFSIIYEFKIRGGVLGNWNPANPGSVLDIGTTHHSPNKLGKNKVFFEEFGGPIDPPDGGGGGGPVPDVLCAVNTAEQCGTADPYGMWIPNLHAGHSDRTFEFSDAEMTGLSSGDARLTAIARLGNGNGFAVDVTFSGRTTTPPSGSPKYPIDPGCYTPDISDWFYYESFNGTLTGLPGTDYEGAVLRVTRRGAAFQVGDGANRQTNDFGASGWFDWVLEQQTTTRTTIGSGSNGDFNFELEACTPVIPTVSINDARELECEGPMAFEICLSGASPNPVTVNYSTRDGSAKAGSDYTAVTSSIVIPAGSTCVTISIPLVADDKSENNEDFKVDLTSATGATIGDGEGKGIIEDCEPEVLELTVGDIILPECDGPAIVEVCLSELSREEVEFDIKTHDGTAKKNKDYEKIDLKNVKIPVGEQCVRIEIPVFADDDDEGDEYFEVEIKNADGAVINDSRGRVTLQDCEVKDIEIRISDARVLECDGPIVFEVCLSEVARRDIEVRWQTEDGTATGSGRGRDYEGVSGGGDDDDDDDDGGGVILEFEEGEKCKTIEIEIFEDNLAENDETFSVVLLDVDRDGYVIVDDTGVGTIRDCEVEPPTPDNMCVVDTGLNCGQGDPYSMWIPNLHGAHSDKTFEFTSAEFTGLQSGNAQLTAIGTLGNGNGFLVDVTFTGRTVVPPSGSPKEPLDPDCYDLDTTDWFYYTGFTGTLTGLPGTDFEGAVLTVSRRGEAFQVGVGANRQTNLLGASGWFDWVLTQQTTTGVNLHDDGIGDFNYEMIECTPELPELTITGTSVLECEGPAEFEVCLSALSPVDVTVAYNTVDGTAVAPGDYTTTAGTLTVPAGQLCATISVPVIDDGVSEVLEEFTVQLSNPSGATIAVASGTGVIEDCEVELPKVNVADVRGRECESPLVFEVCLDEITKNTVEITYTTSDITALDGSDYEGRSGTLVIAVGERCGEIRINVLEDLLIEPNETFQLTLTGATGAEIEDGVAIGTIVDCPPPPPTLSITDTKVLECDGPATFQVCLSRPVTTDVTVQYTTVNGTAVFGDDYVFEQSVLTIPAGTLCAEIEIDLIVDTEVEIDENFFVTLSNPNGATISDGRGEATIRDCEPEDPTISIRDTRVRECEGPASFQVCLSHASTNTVTVQYTTADGSAIAGDDYTAATGTLTFNPGTTCLTVPVTVNDDGVTEGAENFFVNLSSPTNATIADGEGEGTIFDCDPEPPTVSIRGTVVSECDGNATLQVCLSAVSDSDVTVDFATSNGSATAGTDYTATSGTATISAGDLCTTVTIPILNDGVVEPNESFSVTLSNPNGATIGTGTAAVTIEDCTPNEDPEITIVDPELVRECEADAITFTVCLSESSDEIVTVNFATQDGTATAGQDYVAGSGTVTFNPGATKQSIVVALIDDDVDELPEQFSVVLSGATNAVITDGTAVATIQDCGDDPTAVELLAFRANTDGTGSVMLEWETLSELNTAGFELFRAPMDPAPGYKADALTPNLIVSRGSTGEGAAYEHGDNPGYGKFVYHLEEMELNGQRVRLASVDVEVAPEIGSIVPTPGGVVIDFPVRDGWDYRVEFVSDLGPNPVWTPLPGAPHNSGEVTDPVAGETPGRFYRVIATRQ